LNTLEGNPVQLGREVTPVKCVPVRFPEPTPVKYASPLLNTLRSSLCEFNLVNCPSELHGAGPSTICRSYGAGGINSAVTSSISLGKEVGGQKSQGSRLSEI
jgi:hypothetical protein